MFKPVDGGAASSAQISISEYQRPDRRWSLRGGEQLRRYSQIWISYVHG